MVNNGSSTDNVININYSEENDYVSDDCFNASLTHDQTILTMNLNSPTIPQSTSDKIIKKTRPAIDIHYNTDIDENGCEIKNETTDNIVVKDYESKECKIIEDFDQSPPKPSKLKLKCTKRRAGVLYKKLSNSKLSKVTSGYFSQEDNTQKRWIPPRSPYALVQEDLFDKPWQLLVATVFLTKTAAKRAIPQLHRFLDRYPLPEDVLQANYEDIDEYFKPLGLTNTRSHTIMRFTVEFLEKDWTYPRELYGIGKYGDDSYRMFCINEWRQISPDDIPLTMYRNWLLENADRLGII